MSSTGVRKFSRKFLFQSEPQVQGVDALPKGRLVSVCCLVVSQRESGRYKFQFCLTDGPYPGGSINLQRDGCFPVPRQGAVFSFYSVAVKVGVSTNIKMFK